MPWVGAKWEPPEFSLGYEVVTWIEEHCCYGPGDLQGQEAVVDREMARFIVDGPVDHGPMDEAAYEAHAAGFRMTDDDTVAGLLAAYDDVARRTDELVRSVPSLDASQPLPPAPWFPPGKRWSARRAFLHIVAETAQHAGHADIIREALDGQKTMG